MLNWSGSRPTFPKFEHMSATADQTPQVLCD